MLIALGHVYAQIPRREQASTLMRRTQALVSEQPGCISFVFAETLDDPGHFVIIELWRDQAALDEHYRSQAFADYQAEIAPLLVRTSELRVYTVEASVHPVSESPLDIAQDD